MEKSFLLCVLFTFFVISSLFSERKDTKQNENASNAVDDMLIFSGTVKEN